MILGYSLFSCSSPLWGQRSGSGRARRRLIPFKDSSKQRTQSNLQPHAYKMVSLITPVPSCRVIYYFSFKMKFLKSFLEINKKVYSLYRVCTGLSKISRWDLCVLWGFQQYGLWFGICCRNFQDSSLWYKTELCNVCSSRIGILRSIYSNSHLPELKSWVVFWPFRSKVSSLFPVCFEWG